jgi:hypothetical protein
MVMLPAACVSAALCQHKSDMSTRCLLQDEDYETPMQPITGMAAQVPRCCDWRPHSPMYQLSC